MRDMWWTLVDVWKFAMDDPPTRAIITGLILAYDLILLGYILGARYG